MNARTNELIQKAAAQAADLLNPHHQKILICNKCGWAHVAITEAGAQEQARDFETYYNSLPQEKREMYYGAGYDREASLARQRACFRCGNSHQDFCERGPQHKIPLGSTLQGIIEYLPPL